MVRHTLKTLQQILQDFESVSNHFTTLRSKGLKSVSNVISAYFTIHKKFMVYYLLLKSTEMFLIGFNLVKNRRVNKLH